MGDCDAPESGRAPAHHILGHAEGEVHLRVDLASCDSCDSCASCQVHLVLHTVFGRLASRRLHSFATAGTFKQIYNRLLPHMSRLLLLLHLMPDFGLFEEVSFDFPIPSWRLFSPNLSGRPVQEGRMESCCLSFPAAPSLLLTPYDEVGWPHPNMC